MAFSVTMAVCYMFLVGILVSYSVSMLAGWLAGWLVFSSTQASNEAVGVSLGWHNYWSVSYLAYVSVWPVVSEVCVSSLWLSVSLEYLIPKVCQSVYCPSVHLHVSVNLSAYPSVYLLVCLSVDLSVCLSARVCLSVCLSTSLSFCLTADQSACLLAFVCLAAYLPVSLFACLPFYQLLIGQQSVSQKFVTQFVPVLVQITQSTMLILYYD